MYHPDRVVYSLKRAGSKGEGKWQRISWDEALDRYLQNLVDEGKITEEEADQYKQWWQARPDMEPFRQQLREWQEERPDMPLPGRLGRFGGHGFHSGMKWGGGRYFWGW